ncbi:hypothetical protein SPV1_11171 [Mariprofundus ferrooxydans PV-1]|uniref:Uncharacterized protein n=1 Tax=Mariprofundus ferrooxydans PV-1 TaxID=314345 RepID=Q0F1A2_9PROT|nr:hypothetical protein SPV1_11171 [Mariprofundus ferrooxydans PV-1]
MMPVPRSFGGIYLFAKQADAGQQIAPAWHTKLNLFPVVRQASYTKQWALLRIVR